MIDKAPQTLLDFYQHHFEPTRLANRPLNTKREFRLALNIFEKLLGREPQLENLNSVNLTQLPEFMADRGYNGKTINVRVSSLRALWREAFDRGLITAQPPAPGTSQQPGKRRKRKSRPHNPAAKVKFPDEPPPPLTSASPLIDVFWHFAHCRLKDRHEKTAEQYRLAIRRLRDHLGRPPVIDDLTDDKLEALQESMMIENYSRFTIDATRWELRALWHHAHLEGVKSDLPSGPRRPVNEPPAPMEDITSALEAHRVLLKRQQTKKNGNGHATVSIAGAFREVGHFFKQLTTPTVPPIEAQTVKPIDPAEPIDPATFTIAQLIAAYRLFAEQYYRQDGKPSAEVTNMMMALRPLGFLWGSLLVKDFGPKKLKAVRDMMVSGYTMNGKDYPGLGRRFINCQINRMRRMFKWAVSEELAPPSLAHALTAIAALKPGRTDAPEKAPIAPVDDATIEATLPFLPPHIADMVRLQLLTGSRPGEICIIRPCDLDRRGVTWQYRPSSHKTQYLGRERVVYLGPEAQKILESYLDRDASDYCFSPAESEIWRKAKLRAQRKTAVQPSQVDRSKPNPLKQAGVRYRRDSYTRAVRKACIAAGVPHWHPNQLRHSAATKIREQFGLEAAQAILGHSRADVTQVYAERNSRLALDVVGKIG